MRRGTRVGEAYVKATVDGDGINEGIVDAVDDAGPGVEKAGKDHGERYGDKFDDGLRVKFSHAADNAGAELNRRLSESGDDAGKDYGDNFEKSMKRMSKRIGKSVGKSIGESLAENLELSLARMIDLLEAKVDAVSGNAGRGGGGPKAPSAGAGANSPGDPQTLYKSYDFVTMFRASQQKMREEASAGLRAMQKDAYDSALASEKVKTDFVSKFEKAREKLHADSNTAIAKDDRALSKAQQSMYDAVLAGEKAKADFIGRFEKSREKMHADSNAAIAKDDASRAKAQAAADAALVKVQQRILDQAAKMAEKRDSEMWAVRNASAKAHAKYLDDQDKAAARAHALATKEMEKRDAEMWKVRRASADAYTKYLSGIEKGKTDRRGVDVPRSPGGAGGVDFSDKIGRMLGKGSRNNGLNLLGSTMGNVIGLFEKGAKSGQRMFGLFSKGFSEVSGNASLAQKVMGGFSEAGAGAARGLSSLVASGPAAAAALAAIVLGATLLVSILGSLVGIVTALAASITAGLVGALAVGGAAMGALVVAGGLLTAAFMSMTDAQKKALAADFRPLKAEMVGIGQIVLRDLIPHFSTWSQNLQRSLTLLEPLARRMGGAFGEAGDELTRSFSGPGFQMFAVALGQFLPGIVTNLSTALGQFLNGLAGMFAAIMPYVYQFSLYLAETASRFAAWATSAQGQNAISNFVDRALTSLKSLWGAVSAIGGFIADVLFSPEAMNAGNTMFDSIARTFTKFSDKVKQASADGSLKKWFNDAVKFGSALWGVVESLGGTFIALYNSGAINGVTGFLKNLADIIRVVNRFIGPMAEVLGFVLPKSLRLAFSPLEGLIRLFGKLADVAVWAARKLGIAAQTSANAGRAAFGAAQMILQANNMAGGGVAYGDAAANGRGRAMPSFKMPKMPALQSSGMAALNATSPSNGGYMKKPKKAKGGGGGGGYQNPWVRYANSLMSEGPSTKAQIKAAMIELNKAAAEGIKEAATTTGGAAAVVESMNTLYKSLRDGAAGAVDTAQQALNSAAQTLASASSAKAAAAAYKKVIAARRVLWAAEDQQKKINAMATNMTRQRVVKVENVNKMVAGLTATNVTLAEFAEARKIVAAQIVDANQKLTDALALRDNMAKAVTDSIKTFAAIATASAKTVDGVEQALTASDINTNLQDRLDQIKKFQTDLQLLSANGLSTDAYKQIVDQGVEKGTTLAEALLSGGSAAIQDTNSLVSQIDNIAATLGTETAGRMYQAGVDAAQGLVDGLTSLSAKLDSAALALGNSIAAAVKKSLGIKSPSRVMRALMGPVGDGAVLGLEDQHIKVGTAAATLANLIAVNPGGGAPAAGGPVSGNGDQRPIELTVITPTEDPTAVAHEAINELVGRL